MYPDELVEFIEREFAGLSSDSEYMEYASLFYSLGLEAREVYSEYSEIIDGYVEGLLKDIGYKHLPLMKSMGTNMMVLPLIKGSPGLDEYWDQAVSVASSAIEYIRVNDTDTDSIKTKETLLYCSYLLGRQLAKYIPEHLNEPNPEQVVLFEPDNFPRFLTIISPDYVPIHAQGIYAVMLESCLADLNPMPPEEFRIEAEMFVQSGFESWSQGDQTDLFNRLMLNSFIYLRDNLDEVLNTEPTYETLCKARLN